MLPKPYTRCRKSLRSDLAHVLQEDHLLVEGEEACLELQPVVGGSVFGACVVKLLAEATSGMPKKARPPKNRNGVHVLICRKLLVRPPKKPPAHSVMKSWIGSCVS